MANFGESQRLQCAWEGHSEITHLVFSFLSRLFGLQITSLRVLLGAVASFILKIKRQLQQILKIIIIIFKSVTVQCALKALN